MPLYVYNCPSCKANTEDIRSVADADAPMACVCGVAMKRGITAAVTIGIVFSNALTVDAQGRTFNSNAELRSYEREHQVELVSSNDVAVKRFEYSAQENADKYARDQGFVDAEDLGKNVGKRSFDQTADAERAAATADPVAETASEPC